MSKFNKMSIHAKMHPYSTAIMWAYEAIMCARVARLAGNMIAYFEYMGEARYYMDMYLFADE